MITTIAEQTIKSITPEEVLAYKEYWSSISPQDEYECFMRFVFAVLSVHTSWKANVNSYLLLKQVKTWRNNKEELTRLIKESKVGLTTNRVKGISVLEEEFEKDPTFWKPKDNESWTDCRNRLMQKCYGLGFAKTAFALEMCFPTTAQTVCLDTHMLQLYGYETKTVSKPTSNKKLYQEMEQHWITTCDEHNVPPYIARCIFWDRKQKQQTSRYWSYVLENESTSNLPGNL